jgi:hypothetical protein
MSIQTPKPSDLSEGVTNQYETNDNHERATLGGARPDVRVSAHRTDGGRRGDGKDAPPSNTASSNCNGGYFKALRWGVDSLYLSYPGEIHEAVDKELKTLKEIAQSPEPYQRINAQLSLDDHIFEVKDRGAPMFPFILEDNAFRIQVSRSAGKVPLAYVKVSSEYLTHVLPHTAEESLRRVVAMLGEISETSNVSRIDMFVDFASSEDMESWDREAWVTRARSINAYSVDNKFSGWSVGLGGIISARLYDKTLEIQKSKKTYLHDLWKASGWDGVSPVWRLEFELKREVLTEHRVSKLDDALRNLNGLWSYCTTDWLRLCLPNPEDKTRSRWPIHPLWGYLSSVDWETSGGELSKRFNNARVPSDEKLFSLAFSMVINFMAKAGIRDLYEGWKEFEAMMYAHHERKSFDMGLPFDDYVAERVSIKVREFNTMLNPVPQEVQQEALQRAAEEYRKASDGE